MTTRIALDGVGGQGVRVIAGVNVVEGQFAIIRGLEDRYSSTLLNGAPVPSPDPERQSVQLDLFPSEIVDSYELLLLEAMEGDHTLFLRQDGVERAWELLQPVLDAPTPVVIYPRGSWGPREAEGLIAPRRWHISHEPHED